MKCYIIWLGKSRESWVKEGIAEYSGRISRYMPIAINELKDEKDASCEEGKRREGERLLKQISSNAILVALDERGEEMDSRQLAGFIAKHRDTGTAELVFAIGGAYGFSDEIRKRADKLLSLSRMTFTHQMVRPFLLEQIYRACTILNNEPYHH
jgi:23S rRNA (pseudouridine1915-N3)-methyltransferase